MRPTIWCDGDDCIEYFLMLATEYRSRQIKVARSEARSCGWRYVDGRDLCPDCFKRREKEKRCPKSP